MGDKIFLKIDMKNPTQLKAFGWAQTLCSLAGRENTFLAGFWNHLMDHEDVYEEFVYYMEHQNFLCNAKAVGCTVIDIMVWQMDHFKAELDRDRTELKQNGDVMLLHAFDTMLCMKDNPAPYVIAMQNETGTDYEGKY